MASSTQSVDVDYGSVVDLSSALAARELSTVELIRHVLDRIDRYNRELNAFITVLHEQALADAARVDKLRASGAALGPLAGVPVAVKDNLATAGIRTTAGSRVLSQFVPADDAEVVKRLRHANAIIVGKTNLTEFARAGVHPDFGEVRNPWDRARSCSASSSGSACAVAAGLVCVALGSDTGGSIRLPAAACGVVGIKPTWGLVSRIGLVPDIVTHDHVGPLARTVRDAAIMLGVLAGHDERDPASEAAPAQDYLIALEAGVRGIRIGVPRRQPSDAIDDEMLEAYEGALHALEQLGARLVPVDVPNYLVMRMISMTIGGPETAATHREWMQERSADYSDDVRMLVRAGEFVPATAYVRALRLRKEMRDAYDDLLRDVNVIASPVIPFAAWRIGDRTIKLNGKSEDVMMSNARYSPAFAVTGHPAVSIPSGFSRLGLPLAFQIAGPRFDDALVLRVAFAYEHETEWHTRHPVM
jgi:aspartyl-tRNA(Asn)/glutamyl-tRNA(Gln) amidotransferase subunit A